MQTKSEGIKTNYIKEATPALLNCKANIFVDKYK